MIDPRVGALLNTVDLVPAPGVPAVIYGGDPVLPSAFRVGELTATALGALGVAAASLWHQRTGVGQEVAVDVRRAAAAVSAHRHQRLDGSPIPSVPWKVINGSYRCADGRWIELCAPFPHLIQGTLAVLGKPTSDEGIAAAVARWDSHSLEHALARHGQCGAVARTFAEWNAHPQGQVVGRLGPVTLERIGDGEPIDRSPGPAPLSGFRVLDLTRALAGPTHGRHLADLGAEVLLLNSPHLANAQDALIETSHGKRSALLDLDAPDGPIQLRQLAQGADVFVDSYRGGALEARGFGAEKLVGIRPGIVRVSITCYGDVGDWRQRRGFEPIAQAAAGLSLAAGPGGVPGKLPGTVCDYLTGCLAALGTVAALHRRARFGGSYRVCASLVQTAMWVAAAGADLNPGAATGLGDLEAWMVREETRFGALQHLLPPVDLSATPLHWTRPAVPPGTDPASWLGDNAP
jgi:crotonobetainyl-CoA:carnitine CoA-transferase CaiB-like acyl-CoA transferase